jgi:hypothetical protein
MPQFDQSQNSAIQELLQLQSEQRNAHLTANAKKLVDLFADEFINISNGKIVRPTYAESLQRFQVYFDKVTFIAWDDVTPPIIHVAEDTSLATVIVHKYVHLRYLAESDIWMEEDTTFAWQEMYIRQHNRWRLATIVSTNTPPNSRLSESQSTVAS